MTEYASLEDLTSPQALTDAGIHEGDATTESGRVVRVRGLSRIEVLLSKAGELAEDRVKWEAFILSTGLVAPRMTAAQVNNWQASVIATEIEPVMDKIFELSGMDDGAERRAVRELLEEDGAEFRDVPSGPATDDARTDEADAAG